MQADKLRECPFCGGEAKASCYVVEGAVRCLSCGATIAREHEAREDTGYPSAIAAWNTRAAIAEASEGLRADAMRWRWTSERAWFVDAGAYAFDLRFGPGDFTTEPRNADSDDVRDAIDAAMAEESDAALSGAVTQGGG